MSLETALARISELNSAFAPRPTQNTASTSTTSATGGAGSPFASALQGAMGAEQAAPAATSTGGGVGARMVAIAQREMGVAEQPPGSNNSPRIAEYRRATSGAPGPGPWCAYFTSWVARQAGVPVGERGQGFGAVQAVWSWAQRSGKSVPASGQPKPGDLIVWSSHIGIVESVKPDGSVQTIEGNSSDRVSRRTHRRGDALGYVHLG